MDLPNIPKNKELTYLGLTTYRDKNTLFGIKRKDRRQHVYILGKSGTGKSVLMFNMIIQNILNGDGVCMVDPHGENVEAILSAIPPERVKDVVYFNPADTEHHIGFNVLELVDPKYKHLVASGLMGIFTKIWANAWSARMEYILNNAILALLDTPGTTLLGIPRMLVDKDYRQKIIGNLKDPVIKSFWVHEYEAWQDKFRNEAIAPIQNKVGQFLSTSIIRNIVGQSQSTINAFDIMNEGKIFLINVSKGRIGEDNSALLGGMIITKIQLAAMERVRIPEETRKDFYLYVDEFQNFVTDAFASILSEARKYRLNLTVAHQYTAQLVTKESSNVRDSIFGNVGTMIIFRVGADDAEFLEKEFEPEFTPEDIVNLPNFKIYLKLMIDGVTSRPFSAKTMPQLVKGGNMDIEEEVIRSSRALYCRPREEVEREINDWSGMSLGNDTNPTGERFKTTCSSCGKETEVPFKPEPGRSVYCKDCLAKIKTGEIKPMRTSAGQTKQDESKYYQSLADLGIEFADKSNGEKGNHNFNISKEYQKSVLSHPASRPTNSPQHKPAPIKSHGVFPGIKKVFKPQENREENTGLKNILNKTLAENKVFTAPKREPEVTEVKSTIPTPQPISLNDLKTPKPAEINSKNDRSASEERMSALRSLIMEKAPEAINPPSLKASKDKKEETPTPTPTSIPNPTPNLTPNVKEVPEDVLRKVLE